MRLLVRSAAVAAAAALTVAGLGPAVAVDPAVPLSMAGPMSAWGYNDEISNGGTNVTSVLAIPSTLQPRAIRAMSITMGLAVAATTDGHVTAWGSADARRFHATPAPAGLHDVVDVRAIDGANGLSAIALSADGKVTAWGATNGGVNDIPADIQGHVQAIDAASDYVMALTDDGHIVQWGNTVGGGINSDNAVPPEIQGDVMGISVSPVAGTEPSGTLSAPHLALLKNGRVVPWGAQAPGYESAWQVPDDIQGNVAKVISGPAPAAILKDGTVRFWGPIPVNPDPVTGCGATADGTTPPAYVACGAPSGLAHVTDLQLSSSTGAYAMALTEAGDAYLWGKSSLADGGMQPSMTQPVRTGASAIGLARSGYIAAVVTTGVAIDRDPVVAGTAKVGQTLTGTAGTFSGAPGSTSSQWLADGVAIPGATAAKLTLTSAYAGKHISYRTTAVSGSDRVAATSAATAAVVNVTPPPPPPPPVNQQLVNDQAKLKKDQAKLKKLKKAYKKAHGAKKAKLKKKMAKLKKAVKADQKKVAADK